jgi:hypothetical protein
MFLSTLDFPSSIPVLLFTIMTATEPVKLAVEVERPGITAGAISLKSTLLCQNVV